MVKKPRILVIGLDAATMDLIEPWAGAGRLPIISGLMREGASSRFISTPNMHSASAWTSILTGLNPGRHGLFVFSDRDFATGRQVFFKGGDRSGQIIASHLARHGLTSGLLNVPMTYPAECGPGGFMVSGLDAPSLNEKAFCPHELREELLGKFPDYNFAPPGIGGLMSAGKVREAVAGWKDLIEAQTRAAVYLLESRPVDFFMTVYTASDWAGHNLWRYARRDPSPGEESGDGLENSLRSIYEALDAAVGRLLERAGDRTQVYLISDHGMGPHSGASYHLAGWLEEKGYMRRKGGGAGAASLLTAGSRAAKKLLPPSVKERLKSTLGAGAVKRLQAAEKDIFYESIDWGKTTAYTEPGRHVINLNLAGRNRDGVVRPEDRDGIVAALADDLLAWKDSRGVKVVDRIATKESVYSGPFAERASDIYVYWNGSARFPEPPDEVRARGFWWSGDHRPEGVLICTGPGIKRCSLSAAPEVYDLVPTIMYLAGLPVPAGLDGDVVREACEDGFLASHEIVVEPGAGEAAAARDRLSRSEEELIEEKLKGLGYL